MTQTLIDSHVHFWNPDALRIPWLDGLPALNRPFAPADLKAETGGLALEKLVFVQADVVPEDSLREVAWVAGLAGTFPEIQGIVAFAPLEQGQAARAQLEALSQYPLVKGVRRLIQSEAAGFAAQPAFIEGVRLLAEFGYSFDICVLHHQLGDVLTLVERCPGVPMVLDHLGKPGIRDGLLDPWREHMRQLARSPNAFCKLSGLLTEADPDHWTRDVLKPYIDHALDCFGLERVMYGGDWPVVRLAAAYATWVDTVQWAVAGLSEADQQRLFWANAARFYRLEESA